MIGDVVQVYSGSRGRTIVFCETKKEAHELSMNTSIKQVCWLQLANSIKIATIIKHNEHTIGRETISGEKCRCSVRQIDSNALHVKQMALNMSIM